MAGDGAAGAESGRPESGKEMFWKAPVSAGRVHFVDSVDSEGFALLLQALELATLVGMDAEWKPVFDKSSGASPRVSILQIACRLRRPLEGQNGGDEQKGPSRIGRGGRTAGEVDCGSGAGIPRECDEGARQLDEGASELGQGSNWEVEDVEAVEVVSTLFGPPPEDAREIIETAQTQVGGAVCGAGDEQVGEPSAHGNAGGGDERGGGELGTAAEDRNVAGNACEMVFLLDLLALPAAAFSEALKQVLVDPKVLKLGFGFKHDLVHLRASFPGPGLRGCFDKVDPYLDIGKLYLHLHRNSASFVHRGKRIFMGGDGLASISETMLGLPLRKDTQCSNWELRPLTEEQMDYATADACCLLAIFDALQIQASECWFSPVVAGDDDSFVRSEAKVGVAEVLSEESGELFHNGDNYSPANICRPRRGSAATMVQAALGETGLWQLTEDSNGLISCGPPMPARKEIGVDQLIRRFGEKLLISEAHATKSKRVRRKARSRRIRDAGKCLESQEEDYQYMGPPPWDTAEGGDGIPRFLCDAMVEGLARQLRCVGIDAASLNSKKCEARELVDLAEKEGRIILTRDVKLLRRRLVRKNLACRVKRQGKWDQLAEIIEIFNLKISEEQLLSRCTKCNGHFIREALSAKEAVAQAPLNQVIPDCALENVEVFWQCGTCKHVYWQVHATWADRFHQNIQLKARNSIERSSNLLQSATYKEL